METSDLYAGTVGMKTEQTIQNWDIIVIGVAIMRTPILIRQTRYVQNVTGWIHGFGDHSESTGCYSVEPNPQTADETDCQEQPEPFPTVQVKR